MTIIGLNLFCIKNPQTKVFYDIIGDGYNSELELLKTLISDYNLKDVVTLHGRIPNFELKPFFDKCNIGVSFVPITSYYNFQPVTKSFEYILSGLYCIATNTASNKEIINSTNGILIDDTAADFCRALTDIHQNKNTFQSDIIRNSLLNYQWRNIVSNYLVPFIEKKLIIV